MTVGQVKKAASKSKYLLLRFKSGHVMGVNSLCVFKAARREKIHGNKKSHFTSYRGVGLNEYINYKHPFI